MHIYKRCNKRLFGGVSVIADGDLYQFKPVQDGHILEPLQSDHGPLATNLWTKHFLLYELTEVRRQKRTNFFQKF